MTVHWLQKQIDHAMNNVHCHEERGQWSRDHQGNMSYEVVKRPRINPRFSFDFDTAHNNRVEPPAQAKHK